MKRNLLLLAIVLLVIFAGATARPYSGLNAGIAWDFGGVEIRGTPGVFLCKAAYNPETGTTWNNPLAPLFPGLVTDC